MLGVLGSAMGPPQGGWWFTGLVVVLGVMAFTAVLIVAGFSQISRRRRSESSGHSLPRSMPRAA